jgi:hypothetical protein
MQSFNSELLMNATPRHFQTEVLATAFVARSGRSGLVVRPEGCCWQVESNARARRHGRLRSTVTGLIYVHRNTKEHVSYRKDIYMWVI